MIFGRMETGLFLCAAAIAATALAGPVRAQAWPQLPPEVGGGSIQIPLPGPANKPPPAEYPPRPQTPSGFIDRVLQPRSQGLGRPGQSVPGQSFPGQTVEGMFREFNSLIDEATNARAADPRFLGDLRDMLRKYNSLRNSAPGSRYGGARRGRLERILFDDFSDGDFTANPSWRASGGGFEASAQYGLRTRVGQFGSSNLTGGGGSGDITGALLGAVLDQVQRRPGGGASPRYSASTGRPRLTLSALIPREFSVDVLIRSNGRTGRLEIGVVQGRDAHGYRVAYNPGSNQPVQLLRKGMGGITLLESAYQRLNLDDNRSHQLRMARDATGGITVAIDGREVIRTTDGSIRGNFDGLMIVNHGGDYTIRSVSVYGAN